MHTPGLGLHHVCKLCCGLATQQPKPTLRLWLRCGCAAAVALPRDEPGSDPLYVHWEKPAGINPLELDIPRGGACVWGGGWGGDVGGEVWEGGGTVLRGLRLLLLCCQ